MDSSPLLKDTIKYVFYFQTPGLKCFLCMSFIIYFPSNSLSSPWCIKPQKYGTEVSTNLICSIPLWFALKPSQYYSSQQESMAYLKCKCFSVTYTCTCPNFLSGVKSMQCPVLFYMSNQHYYHLPQLGSSRLHPV